MLAAAFAAATILAACGGGSDGATGPAGPAGPQGPAGADASASVKADQLTSDQWADLSLKATVTSVTIASAPVVNFKVTDANGTPVTGLANSNLAFAIAKMIPADAASGAPSRWVSYNVFATPPVTGQPVTPAWPEAEHTGALKDNGAGSYTYTFATDITKAQSYLDSATYTGNYVKADLGDVSYQPSLTHRVLVSVGGYKAGTKVLPAVTANATYDFVPATGQTVASGREVVAVASCNECHSKLTMHADFFAPMSDPKACVVCHTDQQKYGSGESLPSSGNTLVNAGAYGQTMKLMGRALPNFPNMIHHIHAGEKLYYQGYSQLGVMYNEVTYPQPLTNCTKCHDGASTAANKTAQGDNWKGNPSRLACGACHDGINFATGTGTTIAGKNTGHEGRAQSDDSKCALCHGADQTRLDHITVDPLDPNDRAKYANGYVAVASMLYPPPGAYKIGFEIKQVTVNATTRKATVVYRIMNLATNTPFTLNATGTLLPNVDGTPSIYVAYATASDSTAGPIDGIAAPADWNKSISVSMLDVRNGVATAGSQTGPDASGYYTATLATALPADAKLVTGAIGINYTGFVQTNLPGYQVACTTTSLTAPCGPTGLRLREPAFAMKVADGYTARRTIVSNAKCNNCHAQLGVEPTFHNGARNNGEGCAICHQPFTSTGHIGPTNNYGGGWSVSAKNLIHGIHGSSKRTVPYSYEATADNLGGFDEVTYPGILKNCEQCHVAGSYDFRNSANNAQFPSLLWTTEAKGDMSNPTNAPSIGLSPWINTLGRGQVNYTSDNLVSSPIASACFGCHDSNTAVGHMKANGGSIYATASTISVSGTGDRAAGFKPAEQCMICHGADKTADIKVVHGIK